MEGVHPDLVAIAYEAIKVSPIDFGIPQFGGLRTQNEQSLLFLQGTSKCDGESKVSNHQKGLALDVFAYVNGSASWDIAHLSIIAGVMLSTANRLHREGIVKSEIRWGGTFGNKNFRGWDMPHFEIIGGDKNEW